MITFKTALGLVVLTLQPAAVLGNDTTTNVTSAFDPVPACAYSCMVSQLQVAKCLSANQTFLTNCLCNNVTLQSDISACVQLSCDSLLDQKDAFAVENGICEGYPQESRANVSIITAIITIAVSIPIVIARCATRLNMTKRLWPDDYMSLLSLVALLTIASIQIYSTSQGSGKHYWNTDPENLPITRQLFYAAKILYVFVQGTGKLAVLFLYQRVFDTGNGARWFGRAIKVMLVLTFTIEGTYIFIIAFQCLPVASLWDPSIKYAQCLNSGIAFTAGAVLNIASDVVLMVLPIPPLWKLQTSKKKRAGVAFMLAIASLGIVASLVRIKFLVAGASAFDSSFYNVDVFAWSLIELLCVVACGSIPALRPMLAKTLSAIRSTISSTIERSRGSRVTRSRRSEFIAARRFSEAVKQHGPSDSYSLSHLSTVNSTKHWKEDMESPLKRSPVIVHSRPSNIGDVEATNIGVPGNSCNRPSLSGSEDDLIVDIPEKKAQI